MFAAGEDGRSLCIVENVSPTGSAKGTMGRYMIRPILAKYQELKANAEHLHIETSSPIPTDEQLMFEATGGRNKGHVYGSVSQFAAITAECQGGSIGSFSIFRGRSRGPYQEGEEVVGIHAADTGEVHRLHDIIRISMWSAAGFGAHSLPSFLFAG
ncbi:hypothetical protein M9H77_08429 [Catharanthus roseus]|uniref:Uncharacterized protein n=1 Tax=Catharanthus roseus TaxID=4058 RepID=A0ACC0BXS6_CATRO|nr:hypothetical protein M9H77_08429 [Catharanthus roseus]